VTKIVELISMLLVICMGQQVRCCNVILFEEWRLGRHLSLLAGEWQGAWNCWFVFNVCIT